MVERQARMAGTVATTMVGCATAQRPKLSRTGYRSPNEKLNIAGIGVGGKGSSDVDHCNTENIVALCDVDWDRASGTFGRYPKAKKYRDFRIMLEKEEKNIDAVTVSTTDHVHAVAAMMAMKMGKHCYTEKPLGHNVYEVRQLTRVANRYALATQLGNTGHSSPIYRGVVELIRAGTIGEVKEVHAWCDNEWEDPRRVPARCPRGPGARRRVRAHSKCQ